VWRETPQNFEDYMMWKSFQHAKYSRKFRIVNGNEWKKHTEMAELLVG
jgi:hypothetical protein